MWLLGSMYLQQLIRYFGTGRRWQVMNIAIYMRLSKEDEFSHEESNSITMQRLLLRDYVREHFPQAKVLEFADDGYSGTNFDRAGVQALLDGVKNAEINCIIVKDFSRFARDYIELGSYLEQIFPFMGVRFISINDKYDSDKNILDKVTNDDLKKFGMIPEFLGRLPILCTMKGLDEDMLVRILREPRNAILKQYQKLLALDEVKLEFEDDALHAIAAKALERDTGARALRSIIEDFMLDIMYEIPKDDNIGTVTITREYVEGKGGPRIEIRSDLLPEAGEKPARIEAGKEKEES